MQPRNLQDWMFIDAMNSIYRSGGGKHEKEDCVEIFLAK